MWPKSRSQVNIPPSVQFLETGGEAITMAVIENIPEGVPLINGYGPTEVTIASVLKHVDLAEVRDHPGKLASIGRPTQNVTCYVVDPESGGAAPQLQPIGVWGELWAGGVQVARGYLNRPELTLEKFVTNPWPETDPSGRGVVYRTGDRVRWYADGELEFGGRIDFQVRRRVRSEATRGPHHFTCGPPSPACAGGRP